MIDAPAKSSVSILSIVEGWRSGAKMVSRDRAMRPQRVVAVNPGSAGHEMPRKTLLVPLSRTSPPSAARSPKGLRDFIEGPLGLKVRTLPTDMRVLPTHCRQGGSRRTGWIHEVEYDGSGEGREAQAGNAPSPPA